MQRKIHELERGLDPVVVERVLKEAGDELARREPREGDTSLLERARAIDVAMPPLLAPEEPADAESDVARTLRLEVKKQQEATLALAAATRIAFRALIVIEQMKIALPRLEALAGRERQPVAKPTR